MFYSIIEKAYVKLLSRIQHVIDIGALGISYIDVALSQPIREHSSNRSGGVLLSLMRWTRWSTASRSVEATSPPTKAQKLLDSGDSGKANVIVIGSVLDSLFTQLVSSNDRIRIAVMTANKALRTIILFSIHSCFVFKFVYNIRQFTPFF